VLLPVSLTCLFSARCPIDCIGGAREVPACCEGVFVICSGLPRDPTDAPLFCSCRAAPCGRGGSLLSACGCRGHVTLKTLFANVINTDLGRMCVLLCASASDCFFIFLSVRWVHDVFFFFTCLLAVRVSSLTRIKAMSPQRTVCPAAVTIVGVAFLSFMSVCLRAPLEGARPTSTLTLIVFFALQPTLSFHLY